MFPSWRALIVCSAFVSLTASAQQFRISSIDIGQGDSMVVVAPSGCAALFDGGPTGSGTEIKRYLASIGVTHLTYAITSHLHSDHIGGLDEVDVGTNAVPIDLVYDHGGTYASTAYTQYNTHFGSRRRTAVVGQTLSLCGEVSLTFVAANANGLSTTDENAKSVTVLLSYHALDALIGGDLTGSSPDVEGTLTSVGEVEVYKVHHHGSRTSTSDGLLNRLQPQVGFISLGWNNTYGHPHPESLARLASHSVDVWKTEDPATSTALGAIELTSTTGSTYTVHQGARTVAYTSKGGSPDTVPPSVPMSLAAVAGQNDVQLTWAASTDAVGVTAYRVYRSDNGTTWALAGTSSTTGLDDTGLTAARTYFYRVTALDAAGNESAPSLSVSATTVDLTPPSVPTALTAQVLSASSVQLSWAPASDNTAVANYRVFRSADGGASWVVVGTSTSTSLVDMGLGPQTYLYRVTARDAAGNESAPSASFGISLGDSLPPSVPTGLAVSATGETSAQLGWTASTDNVAVGGYHVFRSPDGGATWTLVGTVSSPGFSDGGLSVNHTYAYRVSAFDTSGNESAVSLSVSLTTPDRTAPSVPSGLTGTVTSETTLSLAWAPSSDNVGVALYRVARSVDLLSWVVVGAVSATSFTDPTVSAGRTFWYRVSAVDEAGNESAPSAALSLTTLDLTPPSAPLGLTATSPAAGRIDLVFSPSTDNVAVTGYELERSTDGVTFTGLATLTGLTFTDLGLSAGTYWYRVRAVDAAGNRSAYSSVVSLSTGSPGKVVLNEILANEPGSATAGEFVELVNVGGSAVDLSGWTLSDALSVRHTFAAGTVLAPGKALVVYGAASGIPAGLTNAVAASSGGLSLNNGGDTVTLSNAGSTVDAFTYSASLAAVDGESMNRSPDATAGGPFVLHSTLAGTPRSPGTHANGAAF